MAIESLDPLAEKQDRSSTSKADNSKTIDFGGDSKLPPPPQLTAEQEKKLWRKIDMRLMPILSLMYLASFLDRGKYMFLENIVQRDEVAKCMLHVGNIGMRLFTPKKLKTTHHVIFRECEAPRLSSTT
jgi:hypothetical protein